MMLDGDGALRHLPYSGAMREQPAYDMQVIEVIRHRWVARRNQELERKRGK